MSSSQSDGWSVLSLGCRRIFLCCRSNLVAWSMAIVGGMGCLAKIESPNGDMPSKPSNVASGSVVKGVLCACQKCSLLCCMRCSSIVCLLVIVIHCCASVLCGTRSWVSPPGVVSDSNCWTIEKHFQFSLACFRLRINCFLALFFVALATFKRVLRNSFCFVCTSCLIVHSCCWACHCLCWLFLVVVECGWRS